MFCKWSCIGVHTSPNELCIINKLQLLNLFQHVKYMIVNKSRVLLGIYLLKLYLSYAQLYVPTSKNNALNKKGKFTLSFLFNIRYSENETMRFEA